jgi:uncharacterized protein
MAKSFLDRSFWAKAGRSALIALAFVPAMAMAQYSESYNFLKAVRDRDGAKATELASRPGSTIIDTRDNGTGEAAIHIVTKRRDLTWLSFVLGKGAKPDARDGQGNTALMHATQLGFAEGAQLLLKVRAGVDIANTSGETPLIRAVQNRDTVMVRMLLASGANPAKTDRLTGLSARDYAARDRRAVAILKIIDEAKPVKAAGPKL